MRQQAGAGNITRDKPFELQNLLAGLQNERIRLHGEIKQAEARINIIATEQRGFVAAWQVAVAIAASAAAEANFDRDWEPFSERSTGQRERAPWLAVRNSPCVVPQVHFRIIVNNKLLARWLNRHCGLQLSGGVTL